MKNLKSMFLFSVCIHLVLLGVLLFGISFRRRRSSASVYNVKIVEAKRTIPTRAKSAEAAQVKVKKKTTKVKASTSKKKKKEDSKKLEEFLKKRKELEKLREEREEELKRKKLQKQKELKKLEKWSREMGERKVLEETRIDSGTVAFPSWYVDEVHNRIFSVWEPPSIVTRSGAAIGFEISRTGMVSNIVVERSSGNSIFDLSCDEAVRKASPLSPFPELYKGNKVRVHVTFKEE